MKNKLYIIDGKTYLNHINDEVHLYGLLHQLAFLAGRIKDEEDVFHVLDTAKRYGEIAEEKFQGWGIPGRYLVFGDPKDLKGLMDKELDELDTRMGFLASTGSVAPLVGLFGTVWGIINSFNAIAATQSNSLSAIAPGIAEALFTTAFGLIAAIPAVVAYNKISSDIDRYANRLENFMAEFSSILSREIDDTAIKADMAGE